MLFFWHLAIYKKKRKKEKKRLWLTNGCWVVLRCALSEAESHLRLSTHYHDDLAACHVEEDATTEKILLLSVYTESI